MVPEEVVRRADLKYFLGAGFRIQEIAFGIS